MIFVTECVTHENYWRLAPFMTKNRYSCNPYIILYIYVSKRGPVKLIRFNDTVNLPFKVY